MEARAGNTARPFWFAHLDADAAGGALEASTARAGVLARYPAIATSGDHTDTIVAGCADAAGAGTARALARFSGLAAWNAGAEASRTTRQAEIGAALEVQRSDLAAACALGPAAHRSRFVAVPTAALVIAGTRRIIVEGVGKVLETTGGAVCSSTVREAATALHSPLAGMTELIAAGSVTAGGATGATGR